MTYRPHAFKLVVAIGCAYELVALWSPLPTITEVVHRARRHRVWRVAAWAWCIGWCYHFNG